MQHLGQFMNKYNISASPIRVNKNLSDMPLVQSSSTFLEMIKTDVLEDHEGTVRIRGKTITNLRFADDIDGLAGEKEKGEI